MEGARERRAGGAVPRGRETSRACWTLSKRNPDGRRSSEPGRKRTAGKRRAAGSGTQAAAGRGRASARRPSQHGAQSARVKAGLVGAEANGRPPEAVGRGGRPLLAQPGAPEVAGE